jgi:integrase
VADHANTARRHFKPLCDKLKIKLRWHDMRHFAVSLWIEQGFSIKEVMTFAGHASVQMTMERYGAPVPDARITSTLWRRSNSACSGDYLYITSNDQSPVIIPISGHHGVVASRG